MSDDNLVGIQQSGNLHRHLFPASRRTLNAGGFRHISGHRNRNSSEKLYPFGDSVYDLRLLSIMLVEQEMKLIEGWPRDLPLRFLVQIAQGHEIGRASCRERV